MKKGDTSHGTGGRRPECNELGWLWKEMKEPRANKTTEEENLDKRYMKHGILTGSLAELHH